MIPQKIDLTEHRDFGDNVIDDELRLPDMEFLEYDNLTLDQFNRLQRREEIFGRRRHQNRKHEIFDSDLHIRFVRKLDNHCYRCGREVRTPWRLRHGLCEVCNSALETQCGNFYHAIPWRISVIRRHGDRGQGNLFDLR
jgi:hypothetical protein